MEPSNVELITIDLKKQADRIELSESIALPPDVDRAFCGFVGVWGMAAEEIGLLDYDANVTVFEESELRLAGEIKGWIRQHEAGELTPLNRTAWLAHQNKIDEEEREISQTLRAREIRRWSSDLDVVEKVLRSRGAPAECFAATAFSEPPKFYSAAEFDALDLSREYLIPGVLAAGPVPTIMAGSFKTLKTSIAMDMLFSLASGSMFLNHFPVTKPVNVGVMSGESGGHALQSLARRVALSRGWVFSRIGDRFHICTRILNLSDARDIDHIENFINENQVKLFAIDPAYLAMKNLRSDDAGSIFAMGKFLDPLARLGERTGCTMLIVHHNSRGATRANVGQPAELADIAWSGFAEWAGQWVLLSRREAFDPSSDGEHRLWLSAGGRDGHSQLVGVTATEGRADDPGGRRWDIEVEEPGTVRRESAEEAEQKRSAAKTARQSAQAQKDRQAVIGAMQLIPDGDTKTAIRDRAGLRGDRFNPIFAELIQSETLVSCEVTKGNGRIYEGFRLNPDAPERIGTQPGQIACPGAIATETDGPLKGGPSRCESAPLLDVLRAE